MKDKLPYIYDMLNLSTIQGLIDYGAPAARAGDNQIVKCNRVF